MRGRRRVYFHGEIAGLGTASGLRVVLGRWWKTPYGNFADVMLQEPSGHRALLAPSPQVADFIATTYTFDEVVITPVRVDVAGTRRRVTAGDLRLEFSVGSRTSVGWLLRAVPPPLARSPLWLTLLDPVARIALSGVRTRGSAGGGRREFYGAYDLHHIVDVSGTWQDRPVGALAPVDPPVTFGFGSTPRQPGVTRLTTTIDDRPSRQSNSA